MTSLLPIPEWQPLDINGNVMPGGQVFTYIPGTTVDKITWQDPDQTSENTNPITLDSGGRCVIYGSGQYRIILKDSVGNTQYDELTDSPLSESAVSAVMLPVIGAQTLQQARDLMGITIAIQTAIDNVQLLPGPTGPTGPQGETIIGPTGPAGSAGSAALNIQEFDSSGTWINPGIGTMIIIESWGPGGSGGYTGYGGGGAGGYLSITAILQNFPSAVAVGIGGGGGAISSPGGGNPGGTNTFGPYFAHAGGGGGTQDIGGTAIAGSSGYFAGAALTFVSGSYDPGTFNPSPFSGSPGTDSSTPSITSIVGGTGGTGGAAGGFPGGGGSAMPGGGAASGAGGGGRMIITVF